MKPISREALMLISSECSKLNPGDPGPLSVAETRWLVDELLTRRSSSSIDTGALAVLLELALREVRRGVKL